MPQIDELYEVIHQAEKECMPAKGQHSGVGGYRVKTIRSGAITECEIYPIWYTRADRSRIREKTSTREVQQRLNEKNSLKELTRLVNCNFCSRDIWLTLTYDDAHLPADYAAAVKDSGNYIRRLRRAHSAGSTEDPLRYIVVTELRDVDGEPVRAHHHIITNFRDRDAAERLWTKGGRKQSRRLQPDTFEYEGLARYLGKQARLQKGVTVTRRWRASRNLKRPKVTTADHKITRRRVRKLASASEQERSDLFERLYPGFRYLDCSVRYSDYVAGAYIYVRLRKKE